MKCLAELRVRFCSIREAEMANRALQPDNTPLPPYLELHSENRGEELLCRISSLGRPIETIASTLDDIVQALILLEPIICEHSSVIRSGAA